MPIKVFNLPCQSGCTGLTNPAVYIGPNSRVALSVSNSTGFNAGVGNTTYTILGSDQNPQFSTVTGGTFWPITSMAIATEVSGAIYPMPYFAPAWVKLRLSTAPTGSTGNTGFVNLIVQNDNTN